MEPTIRSSDRILSGQLINEDAEALRRKFDGSKVHWNAVMLTIDLTMLLKTWTAFCQLSTIAAALADALAEPKIWSKARLVVLFSTAGWLS